MCLLLLVPRYSFYAAACLAIGMIGAVYTESFRGTLAMAITPAVLLVLLALVAYRRRPGYQRSSTIT